MAIEPALAIAVSARGWPDRLRQWLADHGGARVRLTALTTRDVEEDHHDVLVIDDISTLLTRGLVAGEHARGRRVVGVYDPAEEHGRQHLIDLGVDAVIPGDESAEQFVSAARSLAVGAGEVRPSSVPLETERQGQVGALVDVRGISGGVGTSEVALALAIAIGPAVVVELSAGPSLAQRHALNLHPNFATAVEMVDHGNRDPAEAVQRLGSAAGVLVGAAEPGAAGRGAARRVVERIRARVSWTLIDVGADAIASMVTDQTVVVTHATPVGISRCLDVLRHHDPVNTHVVLNRAPRGAFERAELMRAVLDEIRPKSVTIIPEDPAVTSAAWNGRLVESGPFVKAVASLATAVVGAR